MANECQTYILFESSKEGINWIKDKFESIIKLNENDRFNFILENCSLQGKTITDRLGTKWLDIDELTQTEDGYQMTTLSAAYPPDKMIIKLTNFLIENFDKNSRASGRYWDENFNTIGIFEANSTGYHHAEDSIDVNFDNPDYWEDQVEPAFNNLEL